VLSGVQRVLVAALLSNDPPAELARQVSAADDLSAQERAWLERLDAGGLILTGLMVKKLRFDRLTRGHAEMGELFRERPHEFLRLFAAYTAAVPPTAYFPGEEAELFREWQRNAGKVVE
jgi:hypothetical protein